MTDSERPRVHRVGGARVTKIPEITADIPARTLLPTCEGVDGSLALSVHSWLVQAGAMTVLIDAGIGNDKARPSPLFDRLDTPWLDRLAAAGARPEDVTHVLLTHLHTDHVGWNTIPGPGGWVPTFPNARTILPRAGYEFFLSPEGRERPNFAMVADSVIPVVEAGRVTFVPPDGGNMLPGFTFLPTPGHSRDHMSILLEAEGEAALFAGDVLHNPVQAAHPDWSSMFCEDPAEACLSRRRMLGLAAERRLPWFSSHCAGPSVGTVTRDADAFAWTPQ